MLILTDGDPFRSSGTTHVQTAYLIIGGFTAAAALTFLVQWFVVRDYKFTGRVQHKDRGSLAATGQRSAKEERKRKLLKFGIVFTACWFFFLLVYSEIGYEF
jgi:hypothetical protein